MKFVVFCGTKFFMSAFLRSFVPYEDCRRPPEELRPFLDQIELQSEISINFIS